MSCCESCKLRSKYDENPKSILGRLWRWHIRFCPGWKGYFNSLPGDKQEQLRTHYNLPGN